MLGTHTDITERKRAEEELQRTLEELKSSNAELEEFAYVASHDLQEPLRGIAGLAQLLQRRYQGQLDSRADEYIDHIVDGTQRMQTLINDLLAYSRIGRRGEALQLTEADAALKAALKNLNAAIHEFGAAVTSESLPKVKADATQLTQLFQNLIGNALKFRGERPPQIHIGVVDAGDFWQFSVRDNGIGIEPQYFERIFQVFQRLHTRREYKGTGIGLAICKKIIDRHGGRIWVESEKAQGSMFYFTLPKGK
jgi:light-regulated signal transduction histidine kinase (bacteriophytochrome)